MILLKHSISGETKQVEEGQAYQRCNTAEGWCWEVVGAEGPDTHFEAATGIKVGDTIANFTKAFGIEPCSKCEQRRRVLNEIKKRGIKGTMKALKDIGL